MPASDDQHSGICHTVLFRWANGVDDAQKSQLFDTLRTLPDKVGGVRSYSVGHDLGLRDTNHDWAIVATFDSVQDFQAYADADVHKQVIHDLVLPAVTDRVAVQFVF